MWDVLKLFRDSESNASSARDVAAPASTSAWPDPRFLAQRLLGRGATAEVALVMDGWLERAVARKTLSDGADPESQLQFLDEARRLAALDHPSVPVVLDVGVDPEGRPYFLQRRVVGSTLTSHIRQHFASPARDWPAHLRTLHRTCLRVTEALAHAHQRGYLHADIKPDNVMLGDYGEVFLIDWGMPTRGGRLQGLPPGTVAGTLAYMAPEQAAGEPDRVDARTDIFLLGATLYHALSGAPPYRGQDRAEVYRNAREARYAPLALDIPAAAAEPLRRIAERCLQCRPEDRYPDASVLRADLEAMTRFALDFPVMHFRNGDVLVREGESADSLWVIQSGRCAVLRPHAHSTEAICVLSTGDVFGEAALLGTATRAATVIAQGKVTAMRIDVAPFVEDSRQRSPWLLPLIESLVRRVRQSESSVDDIGPI